MKRYLMMKLILLFLVLAGCTELNKKMGLKDDNLAEELIEEAIEIKTGVELDLTPGSPE